MSRKKSNNTKWYRMDLHLHTPASSDYEQPKLTFLDILQKAEEKGVEIQAITDHNTVAGYRAMQDEIKKLELLESLGRLEQGEKTNLEKYRRLLENILVLPGFEFTATFGFHILGIFAPDTPVRTLEHLLLQLKVPADKLDVGATEVGATSDVSTAYRLIHEAGGLVVAAHANTAHGVAMHGIGFGGQTKISWTQDEHLHALEVTDLDKKGRRTTAYFFDGSKPEYPRRMHCIQGTDAHRLTADPAHPERLGVGERLTEIQLAELDFASLKEALSGTDFSVTRPARSVAVQPFDSIRNAREAGNTIVQSFHENATRRGGRLYAILSDVVAFANTNGGTVYIGANANVKNPAVGITDIEQTVRLIRHDIEAKIAPPLELTIDVQESEGKQLIRIEVPRGKESPYAVDGSKIYVRDESETNLAVRDEIVELVQRSRAARVETPVAVRVTDSLTVQPPRTGVEIIEGVERKGKTYYTMSDLRKGNRVQNVTLASARRLWRYALNEAIAYAEKAPNIQWQGDIGLVKSYKQSSQQRYDLAQRRSDGTVRMYYGVSEDGLHGPWRALVGIDEE
ncbi:MAG: putative DNA binding domain-containing protein [Anaerolineae bacterium]|nr:putative DNA binding domain-containing protein [Anaerolineae bacterium]